MRSFVVLGITPISPPHCFSLVTFFGNDGMLKLVVLNVHNSSLKSINTKFVRFVLFMLFQSLWFIFYENFSYFLLHLWCYLFHFPWGFIAAFLADPFKVYYTSLYNELWLIRCLYVCRFQNLFHVLTHKYLEQLHDFFCVSALQRRRWVSVLQVLCGSSAHFTLCAPQSCCTSFQNLKVSV